MRAPQYARLVVTFQADCARQLLVQTTGKSAGVRLTTCPARRRRVCTGGHWHRIETQGIERIESAARQVRTWIYRCVSHNVFCYSLSRRSNSEEKQKTGRKTGRALFISEPFVMTCPYNQRIGSMTFLGRHVLWENRNHLEFNVGHRLFSAMRLIATCMRENLRLVTRSVIDRDIRSCFSYLPFPISRDNSQLSYVELLVLVFTTTAARSGTWCVPAGLQRRREGGDKDTFFLLSLVLILTTGSYFLLFLSTSAFAFSY